MSIVRIRMPKASDISGIARMQYRSMRMLEYRHYTEKELSVYAMETDQIMSMWSERLVYAEFCNDDERTLILVASGDSFSLSAATRMRVRSSSLQNSA